MKKFATTIVVVLVIAGAFIYTYSFLFLNIHYPKKGTLTYYILIPDFIKKFPVVDAASEPAYYSIPVDVHPGYHGVVYITNLNYEEAQEKLSEELATQGFLMQETDVHDNEYIAFNTDKSIAILIVISTLEDGEVQIRAYEEYFF